MTAQLETKREKQKRNQVLDFGPRKSLKNIPYPWTLQQVAIPGYKEIGKKHADCVFCSVNKLSDNADTECYFFFISQDSHLLKSPRVECIFGHQADDG